MKGFKLYFYDNSSNLVLLSEYDINNPTTTLTFNEQLTENENDQFDLTFSFSSVIAKNTRFPSEVKLIDYLRIGRKLRLECENHWGNNYINLIITSISPEGKSDNIIYNVSAKDYFSYFMTRAGIGLTFNSFEDEDWINFLENGDEYYISPLSNLYHLGNYILKRTYFQKIDLIESAYFPWGWKIEINNSLLEEDPINNPINLEVSDSNTYNALVELGLLVDCIFTVNYYTKTITYRWKNHDYFNKNYLLSPNFNLEQLNLNYSSDEMYSLLFVQGGEDEYGLYVSLIPYLDPISSKFISDNFNNFPLYSGSTTYYTDIYNSNVAYDSVLWKNLIPNTSPYYEQLMKFLRMADRVVYLDNFILNLDYFEQNFLLDEEDKDNIFNQINNDLRKINMKLQYWALNKNNINSIIYERESLINTYADFLINQDKSAFFNENYQNFKRLFKEIIYTYIYTEVTKTFTSGEYATKGYNSGDTINFPISASITSATLGLNKVLAINNTSPIRFSDIKTYEKKYYELQVNSLTISNSVPYLNISSSTGTYINLIGLENYLNNDFISVGGSISVNFGSETTFNPNNISGFNILITHPTYQGSFVILEDIYGKKYKAFYIGTGDGQLYYYYGTRINSYSFDFNGWFNINKASFSYNIQVNSAEITYTITNGEDLTYQNSYFQWLDFYGGIELIEEKINFYRDSLIKYIAEREKLQTIYNQSTSEEEKYSIKPLLESYISYTGTWTYDGNEFEDREEYGKYCYLYDEFVNIYVEFESIYSYKSNDQTRWPITKQYDNLIKQKKLFWFNLYELYSEYLISGYYSNDIEVDSEKLYKQARIYMEKYKNPEEDYNITYLDISNIIGKEINQISVGDKINIVNQGLGIIEESINEIQVSAISRNLRVQNGIQLTVSRQKNLIYLQKMLKGK